MNIGDNIAKLRKEKDLTQEELADLINVSAKTISSYETNRSLPNIEILVLLAKALDTNIDNILDLNKENATEINKVYKKKNIKDTIFKFLLFTIIFIVPILFFYYSTYISIAAFAARIMAFDNLDIVEHAKSALGLYNSFIKEYLIYLLIMLVNYLLYKKRFVIPILIINGFFLMFFVVDFLINGFYYQLDLYLFLIVGITGIILAIKLIVNNPKHH